MQILTNPTLTSRSSIFFHAAKEALLRTAIQKNEGKVPGDASEYHETFETNQIVVRDADLWNSSLRNASINPIFYRLLGEEDFLYEYNKLPDMFVADEKVDYLSAVLDMNLDSIGISNEALAILEHAHQIAQRIHVEYSSFPTQIDDPRFYGPLSFSRIVGPEHIAAACFLRFIDNETFLRRYDLDEKIIMDEIEKFLRECLQDSKISKTSIVEYAIW